MDILKSNKLIAEFMTDEPEVLKRDLLKAGTLESMHYHDEWDWLMLVVGKISECEYSGGVTYDVQNTLVTANIDNTYKAIVEFIEWYNKKKLNNVY